MIVAMIMHNHIMLPIMYMHMGMGMYTVRHMRVIIMCTVCTRMMQGGTCTGIHTKIVIVQQMRITATLTCFVLVCMNIGIVGGR